jgi:glycosyltransferase involved in cell wall biosynthesis
LNPRVSIGLPVYNGGAYLRETFESLLAQDFGEFELIVSDNASTDQTESICQEFAARDVRIRYLRNATNLGAAANYNRAVELSRAPYFKWAAYDDLLAPSFLRRCVETLDAAPESVVLVYPRTTIIDAKGEVVGPYQDNLDLRQPEPHARLRQFIWQWSLCNVVFGVIRMDALKRTRLIQPYVGSDITLIGELSLLGEFWEIPEPLFFRRIHEQSSRQGRASLKEVAAWFDPRSRGPGLLKPETRVFFHLLGAVWRSELPPARRASALRVAMLSWWARRARVRGGRVKRALRREIGRIAGQAR